LAGAAPQRQKGEALRLEFASGRAETFCMTDTVRRPAVAGSFYPGAAARLAATVDRLLAGTSDTPAGAAPAGLKALIVPHAGYEYSGPIAASAYRLLQPLGGAIRTVVLVGPSHRVPLRGLAAPSRDCTAFATPLGDIPLDRAGIERLAAAAAVHLDDEPHRDEHSLEVQLPFLQRILPSFRLLPLVAGDASVDEVARVFATLWDGASTLIVVSSDLSHYHDYATACRLDRATTAAIEALAPERVSDTGACGAVPVRGLLRAAARHGLHVHTLDVRNSGDTSGPRDHVVGYGAWAFAAA